MTPDSLAPGSMSRKLLQRYLPSPAEVRSRRSLQMLGALLHDPNIWHLTRRSVSTAAAVGVCLAFTPLPFQMVLAALLAMVLRCNLPLAVALVWVSNPVTMPAILLFTYKVGAWLLQEPPLVGQFELTLEWARTRLGEIWQPLMLGSAICAPIASALAWGTVELLWRIQVVRLWQRRRAQRESRKARKASP